MSPRACCRYALGWIPLGAGLALSPAAVGDGLVDAMIRLRGETTYAGANAFSIERQTKERTVEVRETAVFECQLRYLGSGTDGLRVVGTPTTGGWSVRYYDSLTGGKEVTREVTAPAGFVWPALSPGATRLLRIEVIPDFTVPGDQPKSVVLTAAMVSTPTLRDSVRAVTRCRPRTQPDLLVRREFDLRYVGDNLYNGTGQGQTKAQETDAHVAARYFVRVVNDGNLTDQLTVRGTAGEGGWVVRYFDALVGGTEITDRLVGEGWRLPPQPLNAAVEFRVEVTGDASVQGVSLSREVVRVSSANDPRREDVVRLVTAVIPDSTVPQGGVYTTDADFEKGLLAGLTSTVAADQLQLGSEPITLPFIWVPNSNQGTVSKVDTRTGQELGRYRTGPGALNGNPSRTTIDQEGNCWVANRRTGTAVKIALLENGQPLDRDGDGVIRTSQDRNGDGDITGEEVLPWGEDESVQWEVVLIPEREGTFRPGSYPGEYASDDWNPGPRGVAVDAQGNVWLGTYNSHRFYYVEGQTGRILRTNDLTALGHTSYGAVIDAQGILWSSSLDQKSLLRLDPRTDNATLLSVGHTVYGLGLDRSNHLFIAGWTSSRLSRVDVVTGRLEWTVPGVYQSRGVAVTEDGDVWTADSGPGTVSRWSNDGQLKTSLPVGLTPTGVTVDADGKVWVVNQGDEYIKRIDPRAGAVDLEKRIRGGTHYGYSDMTGILSRTATTRLGVWSVVHDSRFPGARWSAVSWTADVPEGAAFSVRARSSSDRRQWSWWETVHREVPLSATPPGKFLQIEVTLQQATADRSPILYDLTVAPRDEVPERPGLNFRRLSAVEGELSWDLGLVGATVEWARTVEGPWQTVNGLTANRYTFPFEPAVGARFFRLRLESVGAPSSQ